MAASLFTVAQLRRGLAQAFREYYPGKVQNVQQAVDHILADLTAEDRLVPLGGKVYMGGYIMDMFDAAQDVLTNSLQGAEELFPYVVVSQVYRGLDEVQATDEEQQAFYAFWVKLFGESATNTYDLSLPFWRLPDYYNGYTEVAGLNRPSFAEGLQLFFAEHFNTFIDEMDKYDDNGHWYS
jgi:hypothetical protein